MDEARPPSPAPPSSEPATAPAAAVSAAGIIVAIAALYFGRDIFMPLALAGLLSFVLGPIVQWMRQLWLPRVAAIGITVVLAAALVGGLSLAVGAQLVQLAENLPSYQRNISEKIKALRAMAPAGNVVGRAVESVRELQKDLTGAAGKAAPAEAQPAPSPPVPVVVQSPPRQPLEVLRVVFEPLIGPLGTAGLVIIFVIFILLEREELHDRFVRLVGGHDLQRSTEAIAEASSRVSRYLLTQLVVNVTYGIPVGIGLWLIGVPNAILWGVLAAMLRFIPYLGPWIAAIFPLIIALGSEPGWSMLLWAAGLFIVMELISNNFVEPWLYGASTGLSSFAIILSAIFWTSLWGPVGLLLATPLTVCLVVLGRHVPHLEFLDVVLGSTPALTPAERFYQRLLAGNVVEAVETAETEIAQGSSQQFYDEVAIGALRLAENERKRADNPVLRRKVAESVREVIADLGGASRQTRPRLEPPPASARIACIAGRTELDLAAAEILSARLGELGYAGIVHDATALAPYAIATLDLEDVGVVCVCYVGADPFAYAKYAGRRLRPRLDGRRLLFCFLNVPASAAGIRELAEQCGSDTAAVTSLKEAEQTLAASVPKAADAPSA